MKRPEIDLLLSKHLDRETTAAEGQIVEERLRTDPAFALQMKQMKALGCVMDIAVEGLRPDENLLANIMGHVAAEAALRRKSVISVPTPSRILEMARPARRVAPLWLKVGTVAAVITVVALGVLMLTVFQPSQPSALSLAARETQGDVRIIKAQSKEWRAFGKNETLLAGDTISVGEGRADIATEDWNCRLNSNTAITYIDTTDKNVALEIKEGEVWANNTAAAPSNKLQIKTAFGTILASDANFDVKVENILVPVEATSALPADNYASGIGHFDGTAAYVFDKCSVLCGEPAPEEGKPAPQPDQQYQVVPQQSPPQGTSPPAPEMRNVTRITIAVSRGAISYLRSGKSYTLDANRVLQEDTTGRFYAAYLAAQDVRKLLGWWESGTVNTPDIEKLSAAGDQTAPQDNNNAPDMGNKARGYLPQGNKSPQTNNESAGSLIHPDEIYLKVDYVEKGSVVHCTLTGVVSSGKDTATYFCHPTYEIQQAIGGIARVQAADGNESGRGVDVDFSVSAKIADIIPTSVEGKQAQQSKGKSQAGNEYEVIIITATGEKITLRVGESRRIK